MPLYTLRLFRIGPSAHALKTYNLAEVSKALIVANRAARNLVRRLKRQSDKAIAGCLNVEDEGHQPVVRILLAEIASAETR